MTATEIKPILDKHIAWIEGKPEGVRANLVGANLVRANLDGANLVRANLYGANLVGANLDGANLDGANLYGANLVGANLVRANLYGANLVGANLVRANLDGANLVRANLYGANLVGANLVRANLYGAKGLPVIKPMPGIRAALLDAVTSDGCKLEMDSWHTCDTTHCLAGWIVTIHPEGKLLESIYCTGSAGALILHASGEKIPDFYDTSEGADERAMNWLRTGEQKDSAVTNSPAAEASSC